MYRSNFLPRGARIPRRAKTFPNGVNAQGGSFSGNLAAVAVAIAAATGALSVGDYVSTDPLYNALYDAKLALHGTSGAIYVAKTGNDTTGNGTSGNPYLTIGKGLQALATFGAGRSLIIRAGTYTGPSEWVSTTQQTIPNGSSSNRTVIRAETPFSVRIVMASAPSGYGDAAVKLNNSSYIWIDGIVGESTFTASTGDGNDNYLFDLSTATHCWVTRSFAKRKSTDQYGGGFNYGEGVCYNVLEDCAFFGSGRYDFYGGLGGQRNSDGNTDVPAGNAILRRCVSYMPFGPVFEPTSSFCFYGSNNGAYGGNQNVLFANCFEIDSPHLPHKTGQSAEDLKWGSFYHPKSVRNVRHMGCGVLNCGGEFGAFVMDNYGATDQTLGTFDDCFVAGFNNGSAASALGIRKAAGYGNITINHCSVQGQPGTAFPAETSEWTGANNLISGGVYPPLRSGSNGADARYAVGAFLTEWGETGFDVVQTSMPLWPYPYESYIAALFAETITKVTQDVPTGVTTSANPFSGTSLGGLAKTFTRRVWEGYGSITPSFASGAGVYA